MQNGQLTREQMKLILQSGEQGLSDEEIEAVRPACAANQTTIITLVWVVLPRGRLGKSDSGRPGQHDVG